MNSRQTCDVPVQEFLDSGVKLVGDAQQRNTTMRLMGAVAIFLHCRQFSQLWDAMNRKLTDIDCVAYGDKRTPLVELLQAHGFRLNRTMAALHPDRYIFESDRLHVDVSFDKISMCHEIDFKGRLEVDYPTISPAELILEKLQIHEINEKDLKDISLLILAHDVGDSDKETVNIGYISKILSSDWGFYHTVTQNLVLLKDTYLERFNFLPDRTRNEIKEKIRVMLNRIDSEKKSTGWKMRARIGTHKRWYNIVEETIR